MSPPYREREHIRALHMSGSAAELRGVIREVLTEERDKRRAVIGDAPMLEVNGPSGSEPSRDLLSENHSPDDRFRFLRDRITLLEDLLVKSEADRAAVYQRCESATKALQAADEERRALTNSVHELQSNSANAQELATSRREIAYLREQLTAAHGQLKDAVHAKEELESQVRHLKKERKRLMADTDGISLADLHYSNERLSAQLLQLQRQHASLDVKDKEREATRIAELDAATKSLQRELSDVERRFADAVSSFEIEKQKLHSQLDQQFREFSVERAECDSVVGALGAKLEAYGFRIEALSSENATLKNQLASALNPSAGGRNKR